MSDPAATLRRTRVDLATPAREETRRVPELDALRGIACLAILIYHFKTYLVPFGWAAVDLFFVLSGYLITAILIRYERSPRLLMSFYARRGLRIWPVYYLTLFVIVIAGPKLPIPTMWDGLWYYVAYLQNVPMYWSGKVPPFSPYVVHLWTLACEEQFYLIWPILVVLLGRRMVIPLAIALAAASVFARSKGYHTWLLAARADGFALGGLLAAIFANPAFVARRTTTLRRSFWLTALASVTFLAVVISKGQLPRIGRPPAGAAFSVLGINLLFFALVGLTVLNAGRPSLGWMRRRWLVRVGVISYGLYVYHYVFLMLGGDIFKSFGGRGKPFWYDCLMMVATYIAAVFSWKYVEKPLLDLKSKFSYEGPHTDRPETAVTSTPPTLMEERS